MAQATFFPSLPPSPPYNVTTPRVLVRWNDINAQNGPLSRVRGFFTIPAISLGGGQQLTLIQPDANHYTGQFLNYTNKLNIGSIYQWIQGANDAGIMPPGGNFYLNGSGTFVATNVTAVVQALLPNVPYFGQLYLVTNLPTYENPTFSARRAAQINYQVTSNKPFSIVDLSPFTSLSLLMGWTVTIAWGTENEPEDIVTRYILASNGALDFPTVGYLSGVPFYQGQSIPPIFCIEIWDSGVGAYVNGTVFPNSLNIFSSILGTSDYRYGVDFNIATSIVITPQSINGPIYQFPINFNAQVPVGITPMQPLVKPLSNESFNILTNPAGSILLPH